MDAGSSRTIDQVFDLQRQHRWQAKVTDVAGRRAVLERLRDAMLAHADEVADALAADLGKPRVEGLPGEVGLAVAAANEAIEHLEDWAAPTEEPSSRFPGATVRVDHEARGNVLVLGAWNYPFALAMEPVVPALAAGNTVVVKPSELAPTTSAVVARIIGASMAPEVCAVVEGGVDVAQALLDKPFDHVFFTGSATIGRQVMAAAAKHLASVTLELGGKNPVLVDGAVDLDFVAAEVARGRQANNGQICLACDYVLVPADRRDDFLQAYDAALDEQFVGPDGQHDASRLPRLLDAQHAARIRGLVQDAVDGGATVVRGGPPAADSEAFPPTVLVDVPAGARILEEEIFGPVLPVLAYEHLDQAIDHVRAHDKPLAMYVFSDDPTFVSTVVAGTSSGGVTVNGWASHFFDPALPFGGVNHSGQGAYHGVHGFRELSHARSVLVHPAPTGQ